MIKYPSKIPSQDFLVPDLAAPVPRPLENCRFADSSSSEAGSRGPRELQLMRELEKVARLRKMADVRTQLNYWQTRFQKS